MSAEKAIKALWALDCLSKLMDLCDEFDEEEPKAKKRKVYVKSEDIEHQLLKDIAWKNTDSQDTFCPLNMESFDELCKMISSKIDKKSLVMPSVSLRMRLAITLRYLIAGDSYRRLENIAHISRKTTPKIVPEMLRHLANILEIENLKLPKVQEEWTTKVRDFETFWEFPHTLGILDVRNFRLRSVVEDAPCKTLILLSILDAHSRFQYIEMIPSEEHKYSTAYKNSRLYKSLTNKKLNIPSDKPLKGQNDKTPYFFVGSEDFSLDRYTLTAYDEIPALTRSQKAFNYRLNRVRLPVEMAFEIMFFRFKIFHRINDIDIEKAKLVIKTCCLLHNYLTQNLTQRADYNEDLTKLDQIVSVAPLPKQVNGSNETNSKTRDNICKYCVNEGNIPEQWQNIICTK